MEQRKRTGKILKKQRFKPFLVGGFNLSEKY